MICPECGEVMAPGPLDTRRADCCGTRKDSLGHRLVAALQGRGGWDRTPKARDSARI